MGKYMSAEEEEFQEWMEGITFGDERGREVPPKLLPDPTPDPEGDSE